MARTSVNIVVLAGSAATLAASMVGIAGSDGYFEPVAKASTASIVASVAAETVAETPPTYLAQAPRVQLSGLAPLPPLQLSPGRTLAVPQTQLDVQALTRIDGSNIQPTSGGTPLTLSVQAPASTVAAQTAVDVPSQPAPAVSAPAPAAAAPVPAPVLVAPPPAPPPAPAPAPATNTKAS